VTIPLHDLRADKIRELAVVVVPPLSHPSEHRKMILMDVLDKDFALEMGRSDAINLITLLEMYAERL
jgi:hypothetical protein